MLPDSMQQVVQEVSFIVAGKVAQEIREGSMQDTKCWFTYAPIQMKNPTSAINVINHSLERKISKSTLVLIVVKNPTSARWLVVARPTPTPAIVSSTPEHTRWRNPIVAKFPVVQNATLILAALGNT